MTTNTIQAQDAASLHASIAQVHGQLVQFDKIGAGLAALEEAHPKNVACDVATPSGMRQAIAGRAAWRAPRIELEKARKAAKAPVLNLGRDIDAFARNLETKLLEGESNYDDQIKAEEQRSEVEKLAKLEAERVRVYAIRDRITKHFTRQPMLWIRGTVAQFAEALDTLAEIEIDDSFAELKAEAQAAKDEAAAALRDMRDRRMQDDKAAAEAAAQAEADRIERERIAAEQRAESLRLAEERKRVAQEFAEAKAAREKADAQAKAARDAEDRAAREARAAEDKRIAEARAALEAEQRAARKAEQDRLDTIAKQEREAAAAKQQRLDEEAAARRAAEEVAHAAEQRGRSAWRELLTELQYMVRWHDQLKTEDLARAKSAIALATGDPA